ncbi:hypothetical protein FX988_00733 [Paraglaciecola mesophila]|uniref:Uncharacterized protein n=1 Tax=Paraglaciecola mesophila TaxID=197222 RepID=A0A857JES1_9ALTE|nr:hypothetical protein [Paraglaciecola mesophila]QHJ10519.1 hypothetical protein FX988_00733 [Paraglaciecola mesophila]
MDYSKYSINELMDSLNKIDRDAHPENYKNLMSEVNCRKSELETTQKQAEEEFTVSIENRLKLLSWLQIATSVGFSITFIHALLSSKELIDLTVFGIIAVFNGVAGYRLLTRSSFGYELSYLNQILQILTINTGTVFFTYTGLGSFLVGIEGELFFRANILSTDFRFYTGENLGQFGIGVDLVAISFLSVLHSCRELGIDTKAYKRVKRDSL